jgi:hypothetical protein
MASLPGSFVNHPGPDAAPGTAPTPKPLSELIADPHFITVIVSLVFSITVFFYYLAQFLRQMSRDVREGATQLRETRDLERKAAALVKEQAQMAAERAQERRELRGLARELEKSMTPARQRSGASSAVETPAARSPVTAVALAPPASTGATTQTSRPGRESTNAVESDRTTEVELKSRKEEPPRRDDGVRKRR